MRNVFRRIADSKAFQTFILFTIIFASILAGLHTYAEFFGKYQPLFLFLEEVILAVFTVEILIRIAAFGAKPWDFFRSSWNLFDFAVTAVFYLPFGGPFAIVLRLARAIRVLRLATTLPRLQLITGALIKSLPSMAYVALLLFIVFYVYGIIGNVAFGANDPQYFGNLHTSMLTLFKVVTLEDWIHIMDAQGSSVLVPLYFITFILLGTMIILNLFIGVILAGFEEVKAEMAEQEGPRSQKKATMRSELNDVAVQLASIRKRLDRLAKDPAEK